MQVLYLRWVPSPGPIFPRRQGNHLVDRPPFFIGAELLTDRFLDGHDLRLPLLPILSYWVCRPMGPNPWENGGQDQSGESGWFSSFLDERLFTQFGRDLIDDLDPIVGSS